MDRRKFLELAGTAGAMAAGAGLAKAATKAAKPSGDKEKDEEFVAVLVDTTRCIGCRRCEVACAQVNGLPVPDPAHDGALEHERKTTLEQWTVVNRRETEKGDVFVKTQCMHCEQPACAAACPTNAMEKTHLGPVIWHPDRCMGCRYCMMACPFEIPRFEYDSWNPRIRKCIQCYERLQDGEQPACVEACPQEALMFGKKSDLLQEARSRIYRHPDDYVHHIYGEHEAGGTGWLYLSAVPFEQLGLPTDVGTIPYPDTTREFLYSVPVVFMVVPPLLYGLHELTERKEKVREQEEGA